MRGGLGGGSSQARVHSREEREKWKGREGREGRVGGGGGGRRTPAAKPVTRTSRRTRWLLHAATTFSVPLQLKTTILAESKGGQAAG